MTGYKGSDDTDWLRSPSAGFTLLRAVVLSAVLVGFAVVVNLVIPVLRSIWF